MKANIKLSLFRLTVTALLALLRHVRVQLTGNSFFGTPAVPLTDMDTQGDALEAAIEEATNGSKEARIARDIEVGKTRDMLRTQANYIRTVAAGDIAKLSTCGFELAKTPEPIGVPVAPVLKPAIMTGNDGQVELRWKGSRGADTYVVLFTKQNPASGEVEWEVIGTVTRTRFTYSKMDSLVRYWFAVRAVGAAGESVMSNPVIGVAL